MAGSEQSGVEAARADLFENAKWILTPTARTDARSLQKLTGVIEQMGAQIIEIDAARHDEILAVTSHLPHLMAAALVHVFANLNDENAARLVAGGWRDSTRIAAGSAEMWRDIALANRGALLNALDEMDASLSAVSRGAAQRKRRRNRKLAASGGETATRVLRNCEPRASATGQVRVPRNSDLAGR